MNGFIPTPTMGDIERLRSRVQALELVVGELLTMLYDDGTIEQDELDELTERLG